MHDMLTIEEAAAARGCSASTIWRRIRRGEIACRRVLGRVVLLARDVEQLTMPVGGGRWRSTPSAAGAAVATDASAGS